MNREIENPSGERLDATWHSDDGAGPIVLLGHGVTGNKDRPFATALGEALAARGRAAVRFSFSGNGGSEGDFRASTISKEVADLGAVLDHLGDRPSIYVGHSMGAAVGVLRASRDERIRALVSLAGMVHTGSFVERKFGDLTPDRDCMWDLPECPLSSAFVEDLRGLGDVLPAARAIQVPWLLIHGTDDAVVPIADSHAVVHATSRGVELVELPGADHVFSGASMQAMVKVAVGWIERQLDSLSS